MPDGAGPADVHESERDAAGHVSAGEEHCEDSHGPRYRPEDHDTPSPLDAPDSMGGFVGKSWTTGKSAE